MMGSSLLSFSSSWGSASLTCLVKFQGRIRRRIEPELSFQFGTSLPPKTPGTFHSIEPDGSQMTQVVNDQYTVICKDNEVHIGGKVNVVIMGDSNIKTYGDVKLKGYGKGEIDVTGTMDIKSGDNMTIQSAKVLFLKGQVVQQG